MEDSPDQYDGEVVLSWSCLLYGAHRFLQWTQLLSTWKGVILFATGLAMVTAVMHSMCEKNGQTPPSMPIIAPAVTRNSRQASTDPSPSATGATGPTTTTTPTPP